MSNARFCSECLRPSVVKDSRLEGDVIKRIRKCASCGKLWSTYEMHGDVAEAAKLISILTQQAAVAKEVAEIRALRERVVALEGKLYLEKSRSESC